MLGETETPTLRGYLAVLWRRKLILMAAIVLCGAAGAAISARQKPMYQSSAQLILQNATLPSVLAPPNPVDNPDIANRRTATLATLARDPSVMRAALRLAPAVHGLTVSELRDASTVVPSDLSDVLSFQVTLHGRGAAATMATAYAHAFAKQERVAQLKAVDVAVTGLRRQLADQKRRLQAQHTRGAVSQATAQAYRTSVSNYQAVTTFRSVVAAGSGGSVQAADAVQQVAPQTTRNVAIGVAIGVLVGVVAAFVRDAFDLRIRRVRGIESLLGTPLLARLATPPRKVVRRGGLVMYSRPQSEHGEAYRVLVANFDLANASSQSKVIMLTSAAAREGKTTATANLGIALARAGRRVAILDFDFHRPTLGGYFGLGKVSGLSDVLTGAAALSEATNRVPIRDSVNGTPSERPGDGELTVIPAGQAAARALDRVSTPLVGDLLEVAKHEFDVVLVDTPPLMAASEGLALAKEVDAVIMLVRADRAASEQLQDLRRRLQLSGRPVLGFIVTGSERQGGYGFDQPAYYKKGAVDNGQWSVSGNGHRAEVRLSGTRVET